MVFNRAGMYAGAVSDGNIVADDAGEIIPLYQSEVQQIDKLFNLWKYS